MLIRAQVVLAASLVLGIAACGATNEPESADRASSQVVSDDDRDRDFPVAATNGDTLVDDRPPGASAPATGGPEQGNQQPEDSRSSTERAVAVVSGKGQYLDQMDQIGAPAEIVAKARAAGLTHLVLRARNPEQGFYARGILDELLPAAHAVGISIVAYDAPALEDIRGDIARSVEMAQYVTPTGDQLDAIGAKIERSSAPNLDRARADAYGRGLRAALEPNYPMIGIVMNPNANLANYPFNEIARHFDVLSPMDCWTGVTDDGAGFVKTSIDLLNGLETRRPISVVGQAYPIEGANTYPPPDAVSAAMFSAKSNGAIGMSFWSWETTRTDTWGVIIDFAW